MTHLSERYSSSCSLTIADPASELEPPLSLSVGPSKLRRSAAAEAEGACLEGAGWRNSASAAAEIWAKRIRVWLLNGELSRHDSKVDAA
jgi:hypothetical protein